MINPIRLAFVFSMLAFLIFVGLFWQSSIDDAFITFRFAEHLADGHGLVFNIGDKPIEGYSNFLLLLILSLIYKVGLPTYLTAKILGVAGFLAAAVVLYRNFKNDENRFLPLSAALFLISPITAFWAVSGLELGIHTFLVTLAIVLMLKKSKWLFPLLPLIVISRPEGMAIGLLLIIAGFVTDFMNKKVNYKYSIGGLIIVLAAFGALVLFRMQMFGHPLPNTYYAKTHHDSIIQGCLEFGQMMALFAPLSLGLVWGLYRVSRDRFRDARLVIFISLFLFQAAISCYIDPVMNFQFRYVLVFLPLLIAVALMGVNQVIRKNGLKWLAVGLIVISLFLPLKDIFARIETEKEIRQAQENFIRWADQLPQRTTISMTDMGRIPYYADKTYYDLWGLVNDDIGQHGFDPVKEFRRSPDFFVLVGYLREDKIVLKFGREKSIAYKESFHEVYKYLAAASPAGVDPDTPAYHYLIFVPEPNISRPEVRKALEILDNK